VFEQAKPLDLVGGFALLCSPELPNAEMQLNDSHQDTLKPLQHLITASVLNVATHMMMNQNISSNKILRFSQRNKKNVRISIYK
jgi:hypothetical protein